MSRRPEMLKGDLVSVAIETLIDGNRMQVAPGTRFTRGTSFMGVDLAARLDEEYERGHR